MTTTVKECFEHGYEWHEDGFCLKCGIQYGSKAAARRAHKAMKDAAAGAVAKSKENALQAQTGSKNGTH